MRVHGIQCRVHRRIGCEGELELLRRAGGESEGLLAGADNMPAVHEVAHLELPGHLRLPGVLNLDLHGRGLGGCRHLRNLRNEKPQRPFGDFVTVPGEGTRQRDTEQKEEGNGRGHGVGSFGFATSPRGASVVVRAADSVVRPGAPDLQWVLALGLGIGPASVVCSGLTAHCPPVSVAAGDTSALLRFLLRSVLRQPKPDSWRGWGRHELAEGVEDDAELTVVPVFQLVEPAGQFQVGKGHFPQADKRPHHLNAGLHDSGGVQYVCGHDGAVLGEDEWELPPPLLVEAPGGHTVDPSQVGVEHHPLPSGREDESFYGVESHRHRRLKCLHCAVPNIDRLSGFGCPQARTSSNCVPFRAVCRCSPCASAGSHRPRRTQSYPTLRSPATPSTAPPGHLTHAHSRRFRRHPELVDLHLRPRRPARVHAELLDHAAPAGLVR